MRISDWSSDVCSSDRSHGARMHATPVDREGLVCDALPHSGAKLVCVTPSHQFPTGVVMPLRRRMELLEYASRHDASIFADAYDREFRSSSKPLAVRRPLDDHNLVLYVGTFPKAVSPPVRLAYPTMPPQLRRHLNPSQVM